MVVRSPTFELILAFLTVTPNFAHAQVCTQITESTPPFFVVNPPGDSIPTRWDQNGGSVSGYLPKGTIVEVDPLTVAAIVNPGATLVPVHVLSAPDRQSAQMDSTTVGGALASMGDLKVVKLKGAIGHVLASDLTNVSNPGTGLMDGFSDSAKQVFYVRRNTPFFNRPDLAGQAVRLKQYLNRFVLQKCCPPGTSTSLFSRALEIVTARDPNCQYSPVFEVLRKESDGSFGVQSEIAVSKNGSESCQAFYGALTPVATSEIDSILKGIYAGDSMSADFVERLNHSFRKVALTPREACLKAKPCRSLARGAKGKCRQGVREVFEAMGLIDPKTSRGGPYRGQDGRLHSMGLAATEYTKYLPSQGFQDMTGRFTSTSAPIGCALIYSGGESGHIEVKTDNNTWCSDYCTDHPRDTSPTRKLQSIMCPPAEKTK